MKQIRHLYLIVLIASCCALQSGVNWAQAEDTLPLQNWREMKPLITGLVSMGFTYCLAHNDNRCVNDNSFPDAYFMPNILHGVVINVTWAQLQPTPDEFNLQSEERRVG